MSVITVILFFALCTALWHIRQVNQMADFYREQWRAAEQNIKTLCETFRALTKPTEPGTDKPEGA